MTTHAGFLLLFAACVAAVFAALVHDESRAQLRMGLKMFGALVVSGLVIGWLMFAVFG